MLLLSLSTWHRVFKIGCYNSLDNSRSALWESDEDGLYFDSKMVELDNNIRNNAVDLWQ